MRDSSALTATGTRAARLLRESSVAITFVGAFIISGASGALIVALVERVGENAITAYATVFLALVTAALVAYTAVLANDTRQASILADRHHQEALTPILTLKNSSGKMITSFPSLNVAGDKPTPGSPRAHFVYADLKLTNAGNGPALQTRFRVAFKCQDGVRHYPSDNPDDWARHGTIEVGGVADLNAKLFFGDKLSGAVGRTEARVAFEVSILYQNMFGSSGEVVARSDGKGNYYSEEYAPPAVLRNTTVIAS